MATNPVSLSPPQQSNQAHAKEASCYFYWKVTAIVCGTLALLSAATIGTLYYYDLFKVMAAPISVGAVGGVAFLTFLVSSYQLSRLSKQLPEKGKLQASSSPALHESPPSTLPQSLSTTPSVAPSSPLQQAPTLQQVPSETGVTLPTPPPPLLDAAPPVAQTPPLETNTTIVNDPVVSVSQQQESASLASSPPASRPVTPPPIEENGVAVVTKYKRGDPTREIGKEITISLLQHQDSFREWIAGFDEELTITAERLDYKKDLTENVLALSAKPYKITYFHLLEPNHEEFKKDLTKPIPPAKNYDHKEFFYTYTEADHFYVISTPMLSEGLSALNDSLQEQRIFLEFPHLAALCFAQAKGYAPPLSAIDQSSQEARPFIITDIRRRYCLESAKPKKQHPIHMLAMATPPSPGTHIYTRALLEKLLKTALHAFHTVVFNRKDAVVHIEAWHRRNNHNPYITTLILLAAARFKGVNLVFHNIPSNFVSKMAAKLDSLTTLDAVIKVILKEQDPKQPVA